MTDENRTLSAAERRERRLKRILGNSEERMKKILSGPDGDEQRLPPMLEGGEYRSSFLSGGEDDNGSVSYENCTGFFVRLLMANGIMFNVLVPWILIFFGRHFFTIAQEAPKFINDVMTMLRSGSCSTLERVLRRGSTALEFLHVFTSRLLIMVSGFLIGHSALIIFQILPKDFAIPYT